MFTALSEPDSVDPAALQRLIETTFKQDFDGLREYAEADGRWAPATEFLGAADGAGWALLRAMCDSEWRLRPTAASVLLHPFMKGAGIV